MTTEQEQRVMEMITNQPLCTVYQNSGTNEPHVDAGKPETPQIVSPTIEKSSGPISEGQMECHDEDIVSKTMPSPDIDDVQGESNHGECPPIAVGAIASLQEQIPTVADGETSSSHPQEQHLAPPQEHTHLAAERDTTAPHSQEQQPALTSLIDPQLRETGM